MPFPYIYIIQAGTCSAPHTGTEKKKSNYIIPIANSLKILVQVTVRVAIVESTNQFTLHWRCVSLSLCLLLIKPL